MRMSSQSLLGWPLAVVLCSLVSRGASAQLAPENPAGAAIDPWSSHGGSERVIACSTFVRTDTIDPWRSARPSWTAVSSGLEPIPSWTSVGSGLESMYQRRVPRPFSWVHAEIIDPWARSNTASFPAH
jgi:hypothetical protein